MAAGGPLTVAHASHTFPLSLVKSARDEGDGKTDDKLVIPDYLSMLCGFKVSVCLVFVPAFPVLYGRRGRHQQGGGAVGGKSCCMKRMRREVLNVNVDQTPTHRSLHTSALQDTGAEVTQ
eukprot:755688-Hanusia_phi.AAC.1